jgi:CTP:molybdopterin cytidylyltransferase MocA
VTTAAVVLAAGAGSRFEHEEHKLLATVRGRPVVVHAVESAIEAGLDEVIVVVGAVDLDEILPAGITTVVNPSWAEGQATSVRCGLDAAERGGHDAVVIGLGDQPFIGESAWRSVAAASQTPIAVATYDGRRRNPVRLAAEVWDQVPSVGDEGARVLMRGRPELVTEVPCRGTSADIDTVEDLEQWS